MYVFPTIRAVYVPEVILLEERTFERYLSGGWGGGIILDYYHKICEKKRISS